MEKLQIQEIEVISPFSEKAVSLLWKAGIFNFYVLGCYIHCMILEVKTNLLIIFSCMEKKKFPI